ncbi:MAG TPA: hypothetical protein DEA26_02760 [Oceanospirillales bacterium]|nr:hypothetical protein [Oceanospirillales bacterium]
MAASDADAMPFPNEETTPPVTKINRVIEGPGAEIIMPFEGKQPVARTRQMPDIPPLKMGGQNTRKHLQGKFIWCTKPYSHTDLCDISEQMS